MNECDCFVYEDEIIKEKKIGYTIERINYHTASSCVRQQLKYTSIIYFTDSIGPEKVVIESKTPDKLISHVKQFSLIYGRPLYRLLHVKELNSTQLKLTIGKQYNNEHDTIFNGRHMPFKEVILTQNKTIWVKESTVVNESWPWKTPSTN